MFCCLVSGTFEILQYTLYTNRFLRARGRAATLGIRWKFARGIILQLLLLLGMVLLCYLECIGKNPSPGVMYTCRRFQTIYFFETYCNAIYQLDDALSHSMQQPFWVPIFMWVNFIIIEIGVSCTSHLTGREGIRKFRIIKLMFDLPHAPEKSSAHLRCRAPWLELMWRMLC